MHAVWLSGSAVQCRAIGKMLELRQTFADRRAFGPMHQHCEEEDSSVLLLNPPFCGQQLL